ncbi:EMB2654 [Symbiodinium sp. CCMP2592]|nr:EMB2654 [Symbiodinium sp. CCMP2592]
MHADGHTVAAQKRPVKISVLTLNTELAEHSRTSRWVDALRLLRERSSNVQPDIISIGAVVHALGRALRWHLCLSQLREASSEALLPNTIVANTAITCCGQSSRWQVAAAIFDGGIPQLKRDLVSGNALATAYQRASRWHSSCGVLSLLPALSIFPDTVTHNAALAGLVGRWQQAGSLLRRMARALLQKSVVSLGTLVTVHGDSSRWPAALVLAGQLREQALQITTTICNAVISACEEGSLWARSTSLLSSFALLCRPSLITLAALSSTHGKADVWQSSTAIVHSMLGEHLGAEGSLFRSAATACYNAALSAAGRARRWAASLGLAAGLLERRLTPSAITLNSLAAACASSVEGEARAVSLMARLSEDHLRADNFWYNTLITSATRRKEWARALVLLSQLREGGLKPDAIACRASLSSCKVRQSWPAALSLMAALASFSVPEEEASLSSFLDCLDDSCAWQVTGSLLSRWGAMGRLPDTVAINAALGTCTRWRHWLPALKHLDVHRRCLDVITCTSAIAACAGRHWRPALALAEELRLQGIRASRLTYLAAMESFGPVNLWSDECKDRSRSRNGSWTTWPWALRLAQQACNLEPCPGGGEAAAPCAAFGACPSTVVRAPVGLAMGKRASKADASVAQAGLQDFAAAVQRQLREKQRLIRTFDVGGTGVKTGLFTATALQAFFESSAGGPQNAVPEEAAEQGPAQYVELEWVERPTQLGQAPGEDGFDAWLEEALPRLRQEKANANVVFGVSTAGDVEHRTGILHDWWSAGGHPRQWDDSRPDPHVADLMGLPRDRTFILHDGAAHLLGCSRQIVPIPRLACLSVGTGVGFGISDEDGAVLDPFSPAGSRSHLLNGVPLSGAPYRGVWRSWVEQTDHVDDVEKVMVREFAGMGRPWNMPWVSLVLGRRGMELAEAAFGCQPPQPFEEETDEGRQAAPANDAARKPASTAYANQWLHFLNTQFLPQCCSGSRRHRADHICFGGLVAETNWASLQEVIVGPDSCVLPLPGATEVPAGNAKRGRTSKTAAAAKSQAVRVLPPAPHGSGLIGAGLYALAGLGRAEMGIWSR